MSAKVPRHASMNATVLSAVKPGTKMLDNAPLEIVSVTHAIVLVIFRQCVRAKGNGPRYITLNRKTTLRTVTNAYSLSAIQ